VQLFELSNKTPLLDFNLGSCSLTNLQPASKTHPQSLRQYFI